MKRKFAEIAYNLGQLKAIIYSDSDYSYQIVDFYQENDLENINSYVDIRFGYYYVMQ